MMRSSKRTDYRSVHGRVRWSAEPATPGLLADSVAFVVHSKKWWLIPIALALGLLSMVVTLSGSGVAPLMYTLF